MKILFFFIIINLFKFDLLLSDAEVSPASTPPSLLQPLIVDEMSKYLSPENNSGVINTAFEAAIKSAQDRYSEQVKELQLTQFEFDSLKKEVGAKPLTLQETEVLNVVVGRMEGLVALQDYEKSFLKESQASLSGYKSIIEQQIDDLTSNLNSESIENVKSEITQNQNSFNSVKGKLLSRIEGNISSQKAVLESVKTSIQTFFEELGMNSSAVDMNDLEKLKAQVTDAVSIKQQANKNFPSSELYQKLADLENQVTTLRQLEAAKESLSRDPISTVDMSVVKAALPTGMDSSFSGAEKIITTAKDLMLKQKQLEHQDDQTKLEIDKLTQKLTDIDNNSTTALDNLDTSATPFKLTFNPESGSLELEDIDGSVKTRNLSKIKNPENLRQRIADLETKLQRSIDSSVNTVNRKVDINRYLYELQALAHGFEPFQQKLEFGSVLFRDITTDITDSLKDVYLNDQYQKDLKLLEFSPNNYRAYLRVLEYNKNQFQKKNIISKKIDSFASIAKDGFFDYPEGSDVSDITEKSKLLLQFYNVDPESDFEKNKFLALFNAAKKANLLTEKEATAQKLQQKLTKLEAYNLGILNDLTSEMFNDFKRPEEEGSSLTVESMRDEIMQDLQKLTDPKLLDLEFSKKIFANQDAAIDQIVSQLKTTNDVDEVYLKQALQVGDETILKRLLGSGYETKIFNVITLKQSQPEFLHFLPIAIKDFKVSKYFSTTPDKLAEKRGYKTTFAIMNSPIDEKTVRAVTDKSYYIFGEGDPALTGIMQKLALSNTSDDQVDKLINSLYPKDFREGVKIDLKKKKEQFATLSKFINNSDSLQSVENEKLFNSLDIASQKLLEEAKLTPAQVQEGFSGKKGVSQSDINEVERNRMILKTSYSYLENVDKTSADIDIAVPDKFKSKKEVDEFMQKIKALRDSNRLDEQDLATIGKYAADKKKKLGFFSKKVESIKTAASKVNDAFTLTSKKLLRPTKQTEEDRIKRVLNQSKYRTS